MHKMTKKTDSLPERRNLPQGKYIYLLIAALMTFYIAALSLSGCNSVTLQLRLWGLEYQLQKGACDILPEQQK